MNLHNRYNEELRKHDKASSGKYNELHRSKDHKWKKTRYKFKDHAHEKDGYGFRNKERLKDFHIFYMRQYKALNKKPRESG